MKNLKSLLILALGAMSITSCYDLTPEFKDVATSDNYFENDAAFVSALGAAYTNLYNVAGHGGLFSLNEVSSDEAAIPHKGPDWEDGGQWLRTHRHEFQATEGVYGNVWNFAYGGINTCNRLIATFEGVDNPNSAAFIAELKVLRAYYYLHLLDIFGNVPLITSFDVPADFKPATETRAKIYEFVEKELLTEGAKLSKEVNSTTYARMNFYVAQSMLSQLYLNAQEYKGAPEYDKCIAACDAVINSGKFSLESNYFANFAVNNSGSKENIFVIPYDKVNAGGFFIPMMTLHYASQETFNFTAQPWNGYTTLADFYNSFENTDLRKTGGGRGYGVMLYGPQYNRSGAQLVDGADSWYPDGDTDGRNVNYNPVINALAPNAGRDAGARLSKYEYEVGGTNNMSNDFVLYRYGEILLNKAEALWRKNNGDAAARDLVNMIRKRAGVSEFASLTADNFLAERGREMCFEAKRRTDLIRFNKWGDAWWEKPVSGPNKKLAPIPASQITLNANLKQNPGY
jgi:starch-binding outer membrane protein, SusD/RagB family